MKKYGLSMAIALLLLVNAFVISGVFYNRSGQPKGQIELTERELPLDSYAGYKDRENTGLSLRLELGGYLQDGDDSAWLDKKETRRNRF